MRIMFMYLGRRGSLGQFTLELAKAVERIPALSPTFVLSSANNISRLIARVAPNVELIDTIDPHLGYFAPVVRFPRARQQILDLVRRNNIDVVVNLMPHIWTPLLARPIKKLGVRYVTVIHDVVPHPGDPKALLTSWLRTEAGVADLVVTLSRTVADRLIYLRCAKPERVLPLFHPDLHFGGALAHRELRPNKPLRLLFFGRVLPYKGLPLLIEAVEILKNEGVSVELGVWGEGDLTKLRPRLSALNAVVENRWFLEEEVPAILAQYDIVALSHVEASQSGVAATALGNLVPVVGMPIGGIPEQVIDGHTGVLARRVSARSFADAIIRLGADPNYYAKITANLTATTEDRSMERFVAEIVDELDRFQLRLDEGFLPN